MSDASRIQALEIQAAHHERTIEELSETIAAQWKDIDRLKRLIERLEGRLDRAEAGGSPQDDKPPPHW